MTAQVGETLIFEGEEISIAVSPLLPKHHLGIIQLENKDIEDRNSLIGSTACQRGYIGTWEIKNGQFYLVNLVGRYKMISNGPILADWFSGVIRVPQGKLVYCDRAGSKVYEQEIHLKIAQGKVVETTIVDTAST